MHLTRAQFKRANEKFGIRNSRRRCACRGFVITRPGALTSFGGCARHRSSPHPPPDGRRARHRLPPSRRYNTTFVFFFFFSLPAPPAAAAAVARNNINLHRPAPRPSTICERELTTTDCPTASV